MVSPKEVRVTSEQKDKEKKTKKLENKSSIVITILKEEDDNPEITKPEEWFKKSLDIQNDLRMSDYKPRQSSQMQNILEEKETTSQTNQLKKTNLSKLVLRKRESSKSSYADEDISTNGALGKSEGRVQVSHLK